MDTPIIRIPLAPDLVFEVLEKMPPGLARGEQVVLAVNEAREGGRVADAVREALSECGPGRPQARRRPANGEAIEAMAVDLGVSTAIVQRTVVHSGGGTPEAAGQAAV